MSILYVFLFSRKSGNVMNRIALICVHTKTRNKLQQTGTSWNELEPSRTSWDQLERAGTRCSYQRLALETVSVLSCSGSCFHPSDRKFEANLQ